MTNPSLSAPAVNSLIDPYLRVRADKVTQLLDMVGDLGLAASEVVHHPGLASVELEGFELAAHRLEMLIREAQDVVASLRLVTVGQVFRRMERVARDLAHQTGKDFNIALEGEEVEIDKAVVDQLSDPLMHLIRNSADHGLETPAERTKAGKTPKGTITLSSSQRGREVFITVADDGRGLNREAILATARLRGLVSPDKEPTDQEVWNYIFQSGFSTASEVTNISGRGVGMDVVQNSIQSLRGRITIDTEAGLGTKVTLVIPLSLAFLDSLIVRNNSSLYAIPIDAVNEIFQPEEDTIIRSTASGDAMVIRQGITVPLVNLDNQRDNKTITDIIVVTQTPHGYIGLLMDEVMGQQQVVMKPLTGHLKEIRGGAGCALLGSGDVAIALDIEQLWASNDVGNPTRIETEQTNLLR